MPSYDGFFDASAREGGSIPPAGAKTKDMKVSDIVLAYCKANNLNLLSGRLGADDPAPILPFLIMDCASSEFAREIKPIPAKHGTARLKKAFLAEYHTFNQRLFRTLDKDQTDYAIDLMDNYEGAVINDVMIMRVALMDLVPGLEFGQQKTLASLMLCNIFAQVAQITWGLVFKTQTRHDEVCPELQRMRNITHNLCNDLVRFPQRINPNENKRLTDAVESYMNKTTKWLKSYDRQ